MFPGLGGQGPGGPPSSISVPSSGGAGGDGPDSSKVEDLINQAKELIAQAIGQEKDHEDKLLLEQIATDMQKVLANSQKLTDTIMGGGPATKIVRKTSGGNSGGGY
jgi:hypothetical protein